MFKLKINIVADLLLKFKQMPIEMLLKPLIGIVYTKLFKAVILQNKNNKLLTKSLSMKHQ